MCHHQKIVGLVIVSKAKVKSDTLPLHTSLLSMPMKLHFREEQMLKLQKEKLQKDKKKRRGK